jgi:hypothetical protein
MNNATSQPAVTAPSATGTANAKLLSNRPQLMSVEEAGWRPYFRDAVKFQNLTATFAGTF